MDELEEKIEGRVVRWAKSRGIDVWKLNVVGRRGLPDRLFILPPGARSPVVFIEFKRRGKKARKLQQHLHDNLRKRGVPILCTDNDREAKQFLIEHGSGVVSP